MALVIKDSELRDWVLLIESSGIRQLCYDGSTVTVIREDGDRRRVRSTLSMLQLQLERMQSRADRLTFMSLLGQCQSRIRHEEAQAEAEANQITLH